MAARARPAGPIGTSSGSTRWMHPSDWLRHHRRDRRCSRRSRDTSWPRGGSSAVTPGRSESRLKERPEANRFLWSGAPIAGRTPGALPVGCEAGGESGGWVVMAGWRRWIALGSLAWAAMAQGQVALASADVRLGRDFIAGIIEKLPPAGFEKPGQYRGRVHAFQLIGIDSSSRQLVVACKIDGEFHAPVNGPISDRVARSPHTPEGWRKFGFDVRARVNVEPGGDAAPRFRIGIDEVKRRDLDGATGLVAKALGQLFDDIVTQFAHGRASNLGHRLNAEI